MRLDVRLRLRACDGAGRQTDQRSLDDLEKWIHCSEVDLNFKRWRIPVSSSMGDHGEGRRAKALDIGVNRQSSS